MPTLDFERQATRTLDYILNSPAIHPANKDLVRSYYRHLLFSGISAAQRQKLTSRLKILIEYIGDTPIRDLNREDIEELVAWLYTRGTSEATVAEYKQVIKQFWKWLHDGEEPPETIWIRRGPRPRRDLLPRSLLTPFDIEALLQASSNARDRAFIAMLWETGARIGELIDLRVGDIEEGAVGQYVVVSGKTGSRRLLLLEAGPYVATWIAVHPNPTSEAPLWCKIDLSQGTADEQISYQYIRLKILDKARQRAGIDKPVNPHHFRHSRATYLANYLTEAQMCGWFGWARGSRVPGVYVHLSGRDIDRAYLSMLDHPHYHRLSADCCISSGDEV